MPADRVVLLRSAEARLRVLGSDGRPLFPDSTWRRLISRGEVPGARRIGGRWYVIESALNDWLRVGKFVV